MCASVTASGKSVSLVITLSGAFEPPTASMHLLTKHLGEDVAVVDDEDSSGNVRSRKQSERVPVQRRVTVLRPAAVRIDRRTAYTQTIDWCKQTFLLARIHNRP